MSLLFLLLPLLLCAFVESPNPEDPRNVWDVVIKTCDLPGAGTDASVFLKVFYETNHGSETFELDNPKRDDFERNTRSHFKLNLKQRDLVNLGLYWWPGFTLSEQWCVDWIIMLNSNWELCFEGVFSKWILHYKDPPTYATQFHRLAFEDCVNPAPPTATRHPYRRVDDIAELRLPTDDLVRRD
ncbi:hypothetical protein QR680_006947 [Steinernema hermaphroditum]|uniref:PLAT domain-containing protein n=1 Tax=Steinernema hermaphroditum TaxID=289476 RepID=A0AA39HYJ1_9BILA|nr:hypothetical protein QR680_006947 [Steinernema hermaphroditum]